MESHISVAEFARACSDVVERVRSHGDVFVVECEGEPICRLAPIAPAGRTVKDLFRLLQEAPRPDDAYLDVVTEVAQNQPTLAETPWE